MKAVLVLFAVLAGFILWRLGLPASFLTGPLLMAAVFAVTNRPVIRFPLFIYRLAQSVIGVMLSFTITAKSLQTIVANWLPIATLVVSMLALTTLIGIGLRRFANLQPGTALLGALPGGAGEMIAMSDSLGADVRSALLAICLMPLLKIDLLSAYLAATPGGLDSVAVMATDLKADAALILAVHSLRLISVLVIGPYLVQAVAQRLNRQCVDVQNLESQ